MDAFLLSYVHRYFVVVDDVWDKESWTSISCASKDNNLGSRIIITSAIMTLFQRIAMSTGYNHFAVVSQKNCSTKEYFLGNENALIINQLRC